MVTDSETSKLLSELAEEGSDRSDRDCFILY